MVTYKVIDNIEGRTAQASDNLTDRIAEFMRKNIAASNDGAYTSSEIDRILSFITGQTIRDRANSGYLAYVVDSGRIIGSALIVNRGNGNFEPKGLNVSTDYRRKGIGKRLVQMVEDRLNSLGVKEVHGEAFSFKDALEFYEAQGYRLTEERTYENLFTAVRKSI